MKGLILSGGRGTRLRPITHTCAKQLVPVANRPILFYVVENLVKAGITDIGIIVSPETGMEVRVAVGNGERWGANITYILQEKPLGLAHAVKTARDFLGDGSFVMYLGDNLVGSGIEEYIKKFTDTEADAVILLKSVENPANFGVAEIDEQGRIVTLEEKPKVPRSNLALVGVYIFSSAIHNAIEEIKPSARGELEITDAIKQLLYMGRKVHSCILEKWWLDTGKKDDLLASNTIVLDELARYEINGTVDATSIISGRVTIGKGTRVIGSTIRGPAVIGENCLVEDSFVGPYSSIGNNARLIRSALEHCVLLDNCEVNHIDRLEDSLLGKDARVIKNKKKHHAYRLYIGDDSFVEF